MSGRIFRRGGSWNNTPHRLKEEEDSASESLVQPYGGQDGFQAALELLNPKQTPLRWRFAAGCIYFLLWSYIFLVETALMLFDCRELEHCEKGSKMYLAR